MVPAEAPGRAAPWLAALAGANQTEVVQLGSESARVESQNAAEGGDVGRRAA